LLAVIPSFAILLHYYNDLSFEENRKLQRPLCRYFCTCQLPYSVTAHTEMIKDLENLKGDLANNYKTIPIVYGEMVSKQIITALGR
jgi:4-hydroxybenzoate polyprenyltransferase